MNKRLFQVLDEMNVNDEKNKTATCACCFDLVGANKVKAGGHVTMGVPTEAVLKILLGEYKPMLVLLDMKVYNSIEKQPVVDKLQEAESRAERYEKALREIAGKQMPLCHKTHIAWVNMAKKICNEALTPKPTTDGADNG